MAERQYEQEKEKEREGEEGERWKQEPAGMSPGGRPLDYRGSEGWASRIITRSLTAGGIGAGGGFLVGAATSQAALRLGASVGGNCLIAATCFCGAQEISRELRASEPEDWVDSMLGGLASGAVLGRVQGGRSRALPMGILFAGVGTGLQLGVIQLREYRLRQLFNALPSESSSGDLHTEVGTKDKENGQKESSWKLPEWFPIQILTEEEAAKRALEKEKKRQNTLKSIQTGELPLAEQRPSCA